MINEIVLATCLIFGYDGISTQVKVQVVDMNNEMWKIKMLDDKPEDQPSIVPGNQCLLIKDK